MMTDTHDIDTGTSPNDQTDPNATTVLLIGFISALVLFVVVIGLLVLLDSTEKAERAEKLGTDPYPRVARYNADQQEQLYSYRWVDEKNQRVAVPVDVAMNLVVRQLRTTDGNSPAPLQMIDTQAGNDTQETSP